MPRVLGPVHVQSCNLSKYLPVAVDAHAAHVAAVAFMRSPSLAAAAARAGAARRARAALLRRVFGVLGLTRARQSFLARQQGRLARQRQEWSRAFPRCAPHTPSSISRTRARSRHTGVASMAAREADGRREQLRERVPVRCVMPDGDGVMGCERRDRSEHARHETSALPLGV